MKWWLPRRPTETWDPETEEVDPRGRLPTAYSAPAAIVLALGWLYRTVDVTASAWWAANLSAGLVAGAMWQHGYRKSVLERYIWLLMWVAVGVALVLFVDYEPVPQSAIWASFGYYGAVALGITVTEWWLSRSMPLSEIERLAAEHTATSASATQ